MKQTPLHEMHNPDLLKLIPVSSMSLIEIGCSSGALAREFKAISNTCNYLGIEINDSYAELARRHCDECLTIDIETAADSFFQENGNRDCWIFGDTLEHFKDPWKVLSSIRKVIPSNGAIVVCIPNAQHWSIQVKLSIGDFRYEDSGLLDRTHLRWFTRQTIIEMFDNTGFKIEVGSPRIFNETNRDIFLPLIEKMAVCAGVDPKMAVQDALAQQYVMRAVPK